MDIDRQVFDAKDAVTRELCLLQRNNANADCTALAHCIDDLNKAWDGLTAALVRQREVRDNQISRLLNELAERSE